MDDNRTYGKRISPDTGERAMKKRMAREFVAVLIFILAFAAPSAAAERTFQMEIPGCGA